MGAERFPKTTYIQVLKGKTDCTFCIEGGGCSSFVFCCCFLVAKLMLFPTITNCLV